MKQSPCLLSGVKFKKKCLNGKLFANAGCRQLPWFWPLEAKAWFEGLQEQSGYYWSDAAKRVKHCGGGEGGLWLIKQDTSH